MKTLVQGSMISAGFDGTGSRLRFIGLFVHAHLRKRLLSIDVHKVTLRNLTSNSNLSRHKQPIPTRANGDYIYGTKQSSSYYILPELSIMGKALDSEEMEHFAAAEKRYQEKIDQIDANYNMDDLLMELRKTTPSTSTKFGQPTSTSTPLLMEYEIWSAA